MAGLVMEGKLHIAFWSESITDTWSNFVVDNMEATVFDLGSGEKTVVENTPKFRFNANNAVFRIDDRIYYTVLNEEFNGVYKMNAGKLEKAFEATSGGSVLYLHKLGSGGD
jgi:hypothetical protein